MHFNFLLIISLKFNFFATNKYESWLPFKIDSFPIEKPEKNQIFGCLQTLAEPGARESSVSVGSEAMARRDRSTATPGRGNKSSCQDAHKIHQGH